MKNLSWYGKQARLCADRAVKARTDAGRARFLELERSFQRMDRLAEWLDGQISPFARQRPTVELLEAA